jgi:ribosomal protein S18 acetylase RimI-like enzyme
MTESMMTIRLCAPEDTPKIVPMLQAQVAASGRPAPDPDALAELVHALLATQFSDFLLAEAGDRVLGVLQINYRLSSWEVAPYAVIEDFYLAPDLRGKGAGTRMIDYACARAEARGSRFIQAVAHADDRAATRLYEAYGFTVAPRNIWRSELPLGCSTQPDEQTSGAHDIDEVSTS